MDWRKSFSFDNKANNKQHKDSYWHDHDAALQNGILPPIVYTPNVYAISMRYSKIILSFISRIVGKADQSTNSLPRELIADKQSCIGRKCSNNGNFNSSKKSPDPSTF